MREILFRGKTSKGVFTYGLPTHEMEYIFGGDDLDSPDAYLVDPSTIGQYIGLKDKDGTKIFEGDILKDAKDGTICTVFFVGGGFVIESNPKYFGYGDQGGTNPTEPLAEMQTRQYIEGTHVVIGNIYENKELLK